MNDDDPASDAQSVAYHSDKIGSPKQDLEIDEHVEGSDKPINFSALKDQHIEFTGLAGSTRVLHPACRTVLPPEVLPRLFPSSRGMGAWVCARTCSAR